MSDTSVAVILFTISVDNSVSNPLSMLYVRKEKKLVKK